MYFSAENKPYWQLTAIESLRQAEYDAVYEDFAEKYPVIRNSDVLDDIK